MTTFAKKSLSGASNGLPVKVVATGSPGTTIHTAIAGTASWDEIWLYAVNSDTVDRKLTLQWGGTTSPDDDIEQVIPAEGGLVLIAPGLPLQNGLIVKAFAAAANVVLIHGFVNEIV